MPQRRPIDKVFLNEMKAQYPRAFLNFTYWFTGYKSEVNWKKLFYDKSGDAYDWSQVAPEFEGLPYALQFGIFVEFMLDLDLDYFMNPKVHIKDLMNLSFLELSKRYAKA